MKETVKKEGQEPWTTVRTGPVVATGSVEPELSTILAGYHTYRARRSVTAQAFGY